MTGRLFGKTVRCKRGSTCHRLGYASTVLVFFGFLAGAVTGGTVSFS